MIRVRANYDACSRWQARTIAPYITYAEAGFQYRQPIKTQ